MIWLCNTRFIRLVTYAHHIIVSKPATGLLQVGPAAHTLVAAWVGHAVLQAWHAMHVHLLPAHSRAALQRQQVGVVGVDGHRRRGRPGKRRGAIKAAKCDACSVHVQGWRRLVGRVKGAQPVYACFTWVPAHTAATTPTYQGPSAALPVIALCATGVDKDVSCSAMAAATASLRCWASASRPRMLRGV